MSLFQKAIFGILMITILVSIGFSLMTANTDASNAASCVATTVAAIENSDFNANVINASLDSVAAENENMGYVMTIKVYDEDGTKHEYASGGGRASADEIKDAVMASVILQYDYRMVALNSVIGHEKRGYAR